MTTTDECNWVECGPQLLAISEAIVQQAQISKRIIAMFDIVYAWLPHSGLRQTGHNYAIYQPTPAGVLMRVGFPISEPFDDTAAVKCITLIAGRAVHTAHFGEYSGLRAAYQRLQAWCAQQSVDSNGKISWEVYGDPHHDPSKNRTDIYILVEPA